MPYPYPHVETWRVHQRYGVSCVDYGTVAPTPPKRGTALRGLLGATAERDRIEEESRTHYEPSFTTSEVAATVRASARPCVHTAQRLRAFHGMQRCIDPAIAVRLKPSSHRCRPCISLLPRPRSAAHCHAMQVKEKPIRERRVTPMGE